MAKLALPLDEKHVVIPNSVIALAGQNRLRFLVRLMKLYYTNIRRDDWTSLPRREDVPFSHGCELGADVMSAL